MKRIRIIVLLLSALAALLAFSFSREQQIRRHTAGWHRAVRNTTTNVSATILDRVYLEVIDKSPGMYWMKKANDHERSLLKLGYLTNCEFRLTNQVITREFSSNFFRLIHQRAGTNNDQVWRSPYLEDRTGLSPTFPVKDHTIWEQTFRECATLYASNLTPGLTTNSSR